MHRLVVRAVASEDRRRGFCSPRPCQVVDHSVLSLPRPYREQRQDQEHHSNDHTDEYQDLHCLAPRRPSQIPV
jgi:hypothetical protein